MGYAGAWGFPEDISTFRYIVEGEVLHAPCLRCKDFDLWQHYLRIFVDNDDDDLARYLQDAPDRFPEEAWQHRPYALDHISEVLPTDEMFSDEESYCSDDPPIYEGPMKLWRHQFVMEQMEIERSHCTQEELHNAWPLRSSYYIAEDEQESGDFDDNGDFDGDGEVDYFHNQAYEDAEHFGDNEFPTDHPAWPYYGDDGFNTATPIHGHGIRYPRALRPPRPVQVNHIEDSVMIRMREMLQFNMGPPLVQDQIELQRPEPPYRISTPFRVFFARIDAGDY